MVINVTNYAHYSEEGKPKEIICLLPNQGAIWTLLPVIPFRGETEFEMPAASKVIISCSRILMKWRTFKT